MLTCILTYLEPSNRSVFFPIPPHWACPGSRGIALLACLCLEVLLLFARGSNERRRQDAKGKLVVMAASSPQGFTATKAFERSISGTQVCWRPLWSISSSSSSTALGETHTHPPPETLLPQCVFEYYTWSNFWKSLIADGRILLGKC